MMTKNFLSSLSFVFAITAATFSAQSIAQEAWPNRAIRLVVPFQAGSATDAAARVVGSKLSTLLQQTVIIDNRVGGSGLIGAAAVARAPADGYTILLGTVSTQVVSVILNPKLSFDPEKDLEPVGLIGTSPYVLVSSSKSAARDIQGLIAEARAKPGNLTYASAGTTSMANFVAQLFSSKAEVQLTHVPYKSSAQAVVDTINGTVGLQFGTVMPVLTHIKSGSLKAFAVTGTKRLALLPDVPTLSEVGLRGFDVGLWMGVFSPKGTPVQVLEKLSAALSATLSDTEVQKAFLAQGIEISPIRREEFAKFVRAETGKWSQVVKTSGITEE
jgi:tripartite-type tricarboxylate transporter receptor subunit TctC